MSEYCTSLYIQDAFRWNVNLADSSKLQKSEYLFWDSGLAITLDLHNKKEYLSSNSFSKRENTRTFNVKDIQNTVSSYDAWFCYLEMKITVNKGEKGTCSNFRAFEHTVTQGFVFYEDLHIFFFFFFAFFPSKRPKISERKETEIKEN